MDSYDHEFVIAMNELHLESMAQQDDEEVRKYCLDLRNREADTEFMDGELNTIEKAWEQVEAALVISGLFDIDPTGAFTMSGQFKTPAARSILSRLTRPLSLSKRILHFLTAERV